jgi:hypothetical protein
MVLVFTDRFRPFSSLVLHIIALQLQTLDRTIEIKIPSHIHKKVPVYCTCRKKMKERERWLQAVQSHACAPNLVTLDLVGSSSTIVRSSRMN